MPVTLGYCFSSDGETAGRRRTIRTMSRMMTIRPTPPPTAIPMIAPVDNTGLEEVSVEEAVEEEAVIELAVIPYVLQNVLELQ